MAAYVFIDVSRKQEFIFKRNRLIDNLYYSFIIKSVTEKLEVTGFPIPKTSLCNFLQANYPRESEFVYSGGGNSIIRFRDEAKGKNFVRTYSRAILEDYPDLELYISLVHDAEIATDCVNREKAIRSLLHARADQLKDKRRSMFRRWSYGVEKIDETGLPVTWDKEIKLDEKMARKYLHQLLKDDLQGTRIGVTAELKKYKKGEDGKSYIGVIAIDGNKMGEMVKRISTFNELASFSKVIESIYRQAVVDALKDCDKRLNPHPDKQILITPVLIAGDDICLIIEAEYAIEVAADIVKHIKKISAGSKTGGLLSQDGMPAYLSACAGVAIAKYSYPFFEAVKAAEMLCHQAKDMIDKAKYQEEGLLRQSYINWEVLQGQHAAIAGYEGYVKHGQMQERFHIKPLCVDQNQAVMADGIYHYDAFVELARKIAADEGISNSLLEGLKKNFYSGWEQYKLFLDMRSDCESLAAAFASVFGDGSKVGRYAAHVDGDGSLITYILNDVVDILPFIYRREVDAIAAADKI